MFAFGSAPAAEGIGGGAGLSDLLSDFCPTFFTASPAIRHFRDIRGNLGNHPKPLICL
jgi:hypothetical protein